MELYEEIAKTFSTIEKSFEPGELSFFIKSN